MIHVTRLDGSDLVVNCDLILVVDRTPDTLITMVTGERFLLREPLEEVIERTVRYRRRLYREAGPTISEEAGHLGNDRPPALSALEPLRKKDE